MPPKTAPARNVVKIKASVGSYTDGHHSALLMPVFQGEWGASGIFAAINAMSPVKPQDLIVSGEIKGEFREFTILHLPAGNPFERVVLIGSGKAQDFGVDRLRSISAQASRTLRRMGQGQMVVVPEAFGGLDPQLVGQAVAEGVLLGLYRFQKMSGDAPKKEVQPEILMLCKDAREKARVSAGIERGMVMAQATNQVRDWANEPPNLRTPAAMAQTARDIAKARKLTCEVLDSKALIKQGFGGIMSVGQGSENAPCLIRLEYRGGGKNGPTIALVGKGVTFDTGGISIKPSSGMHQMKYDMSGAAAVLGAIDGIAALKLPVNVIALAPCAENMPDGKAYRPGDVIRMYGGKCVEIINTDAEGRMLLADALAWASKQDVDLVVDIATLTGGCVVALGHIASGVMGNDPWVVGQVIRAGQDCDEKSWELPLFGEYLVQIKSQAADLVNSGGAPASAITAGMFLRQFIDNKPWAHIDIAGTAWIEEDTTLYFHKTYLPKKGATGVGVRTLIHLAERVATECKGSRSRLKSLLGSKA